MHLRHVILVRKKTVFTLVEPLVVLSIILFCDDHVENRTLESLAITRSVIDRLTGATKTVLPLLPLKPTSSNRFFSKTSHQLHKIFTRPGHSVVVMNLSNIEARLARLLNTHISIHKSLRTRFGAPVRRHFNLPRPKKAPRHHSRD